MTGWRRNTALVVPLVLVNAFAMYGQGQWALVHIASGLAIAGAFAVALESIAVYLAYEAHAALMAGDAALRLRLASYAAGMLVGGLNYEVHAPDWAPNPAAVTFAAMSAVSPWLWSIRSRSMHRDQLRSAGLIDPRSVRFSAARWLLYPVRTFRAFRRAVWVGVVDPAVAVGLAGTATAGTFTASRGGGHAAPTQLTSTEVSQAEPRPAGTRSVAASSGRESAVEWVLARFSESRRWPTEAETMEGLGRSRSSANAVRAAAKARHEAGHRPHLVRDAL